MMDEFKRAMTILNRLYQDMRAKALHPSHIHSPQIILNIDGSGYAEIRYYDGSMGFHCAWGNIDIMIETIDEQAGKKLHERLFGKD